VSPRFTLPALARGFGMPREVADVFARPALLDAPDVTAFVLELNGDADVAAALRITRVSARRDVDVSHFGVVGPGPVGNV
jgi:hypothetical protein